MARKPTANKAAAAAKTKTIGINMDKKMAAEIEKRASSMHLATGKYCKLILAEWVASGQKLNLSEH